MTDEQEPDDTPLRRDHVDAFLVWFRARVKFPRYGGVEEEWWNALHTLNVGQLRDGMRWFTKLSSPKYLTPPWFHAVCRRGRNPSREEVLEKMRKELRRNGKPQVNPPQSPSHSRKISGDNEP